MEMRKEARAIVARPIINSDEVYKVDKQQIVKNVYIWAMIVFGIVGFFVGFNLYKPLNSIQITDCEKVAQEIYKDADNGMIGIPQGYLVQEGETEIKVSKDNHVGIVTATIQNNELMFKYDEEVGRRILQGIGFMLIGVLFVNLIRSIIRGFVESIKDDCWKVRKGR